MQEVLRVCAHLGAREDSPGLTSRKEPPSGGETQKSVCKDGFRKEKKSQGTGIQFYTSAYTCALANTEVRTELGSARPELRTSHGLYFWGQSHRAPTKPSLQDCSTATLSPHFCPKVQGMGDRLSTLSL